MDLLTINKIVYNKHIGLLVNFSGVKPPSFFSASIVMSFLKGGWKFINLQSNVSDEAF